MLLHIQCAASCKLFEFCLHSSRMLTDRFAAKRRACSGDRSQLLPAVAQRRSTLRSAMHMGHGCHPLGLHQCWCASHLLRAIVASRSSCLRLPVANPRRAAPAARIARGDRGGPQALSCCCLCSGQLWSLLHACDTCHRDAAAHRVRLACLIRTRAVASCRGHVTLPPGLRLHVCTAGLPFAQASSNCQVPVRETSVTYVRRLTASLTYPGSIRPPLRRRFSRPYAAAPQHRQRPPMDAADTGAPRHIGAIAPESRRTHRRPGR